MLRLMGGVTVHGQPLDWFQWIALVGVALTLSALAVTMVQLFRTRRAAVAATEAVGRALRAVNRSDLMLQIQSLRQLEADLDGALEGQGDKTAVLRILREWREIGAAVYAGLEQEAPEKVDLRGSVESSRQSASSAKVLVERKNLHAATSDFRSDVTRVSNDLGLYVNKLMRTVGGEELDE
jgi:hypothetical protein